MSPHWRQKVEIQRAFQPLPQKEKDVDLWERQVARYGSASRSSKIHSKFKFCRFPLIRVRTRERDLLAEGFIVSRPFNGGGGKLLTLGIHVSLVFLEPAG